MVVTKDEIKYVDTSVPCLYHLFFSLLREFLLHSNCYTSKVDLVPDASSASAQYRQLCHCVRVSLL